MSEYKALSKLLNRSTIQRISMEHDLRNSSTIDECVVLTMNILRLTVLFHAGPLFAIVVSVISRLSKALLRTTLHHFLLADPDGLGMYIWICFVGLINDFDSKNRIQFREMLNSALSVEYRESSWPEDWQGRNLNMLRTFLWSEAVLTKLYWEACRLIEAHSLTPKFSQAEY